MQITSAALLAAEWRSVGRQRTPAQDSRSAHGLLYLAAVRDDRVPGRTPSSPSWRRTISLGTGLSCFVDHSISSSGLLAFSV